MGTRRGLVAACTSLWVALAALPLPAAAFPGSFVDSGQSFGSGSSEAVLLFDVELDGDVDAFVANATGNRVWLNDGSATFSDSGQSLGGAASLGVGVGDLDGDSDLDAFVANGSSTADRVWINVTPPAIPGLAGARALLAAVALLAATLWVRARSQQAGGAGAA